MKSLEHEVAKKSVEQKLSHAFRYGSSAFRFGLIPEGVSDHLPIVSEVSVGERKVKLSSWNLLADEHLFNNFMNITGSDLLRADLDVRLDGQKNNIYHNAMYHLFAEIAQYLYKHANEDGRLDITKALLEGFLSTKTQPSRLTRSRNPDTVTEKTKQVEDARQVLIRMLCDVSHEHHHEYQLALKQSLELIYHIQSPGGALKWENRFRRFCEHEAAVAELLDQDILALQECTNPSDIEGLFNERAGKNMAFICHNTSRTGHSTDNVVLAYNTNRFKLVTDESITNPVFGSFEGKKPALYCKLEDLETKEQFIVGSIHHPGGPHDLRHEILETVNELQAGQSDMPYYIMGDYNHTQKQFNRLSSESIAAEQYHMLYPVQTGTMAGSDYGNSNRTIDAILSNRTADVEVSEQVRTVPPALTALSVAFHLAPVSPVTITDPVLRPHIHEADQKRFKGELRNIRKAARNSIFSGLQNVHDDESEALETRTPILVFKT